MTTSQVDKFVTGNQPQITDSKIYSGGPIAPYEGGQRHTRQPPDTKYKIYGKKPVPVVLVRLIDADADSEPFTINESDFDDAVHELAEA